MHTKIIPMLKHICLLSVVILFAACRDKGKNGDLLDEMAGREINEPYEPLFLQDTAVASLKKVTIKDNYYKPAIYNRQNEMYIFLK